MCVCVCAHVCAHVWACMRACVGMCAPKENIGEWAYLQGLLGKFFGVDTKLVGSIGSKLLVNCRRFTKCSNVFLFCIIALYGTW